MKYTKKQNEKLDAAFTNAAKHGFYVKFSDSAIFYRKGLHWEYVLPEDIARIHRHVEEVLSHTSCCAENMDIQRLVLTLKNDETVSIHVCDGEPRLAEKLYSDIQAAWPDIAYGTKSNLS